MSDDPLWTNIFHRKKEKEESIPSILKSIPIFSDMNKKELKGIENILHRRFYNQDELIFEEGEPGLGMYIIESGSVNIYFGEDKKLLAVLSKGDFFGEMALLLDTPRTARSVATSSTNLLGFFRPDLFSLIETLPETGNKILMHLAQMIAERLKHTSLENQQLRLKLNKLESKNISKAK